MAQFLHHEPCPACGSRDNLGRYDDGSAWCFGCGHYERATRLRKLTEAPKRPVERFYELEATLPPDHIQYLKERGLTDHEIKELFRFNPKTGRQVFEIHSSEGAIVYAEERAIDGRLPKTMSHGNKAIQIFGSKGSRVASLVLVEDVLSAIRVGHVQPAAALFGSNIPKAWVPYLQGITHEIVLWLDKDKYVEAVKQAKQLRIRGFSTRVISTEKDPKWYTEEEIRGYLATPVD